MASCFPPFIGACQQGGLADRGASAVSVVMVLSLGRFLEGTEISTARPDVGSFGFVVVDSYEYFYEYLFGL